MADIKADARPEKRLFISLLTRDIPLVAAFLDLLDNSINAAVEPVSPRLKTAIDYMTVFEDPSITPSVNIALAISKGCVEISDDAFGISAKTAAEHVFKFGRADGEHHEADRLSVYGIGLKRAMFKLGNRIKMRSDHIEGGFDLDLDVSNWAKDESQPWTFDITPRAPVAKGATGTSIMVTELYDEVTRRLEDGLFPSQLEAAISRTYAYYLAKFVSVSVNGKNVEGVSIQIGGNHTAESFNFGDVTCAITAGIGTPEAGVFRDRSSGWFVFCNGRAVISADKSLLTGWGGGGLPIFQPKHRPFLGTVFFVSENAEHLPWTTTKSAINEDSEVWQLAKRHMAATGRTVVSFLDGRYTDEGTEVASKDLQAATSSSVSVLKAAVTEKRAFVAPKAATAPTTVRIQYDAQVSQIKDITNYLKRPSMSGSDVGRYTFNYFLRNEVGEK
ncbi:ATP-binding protein [Sphingomonas sp. RT2P30]|uniref:ATP-binding protein n=1 Tax=Parasphingomonas halimpatiens TaxID=3096162 RepID=UPI002FCA27DB